MPDPTFKKRLSSLLAEEGLVTAKASIPREVSKYLGRHKKKFEQFLEDSADLFDDLPRDLQKKETFREGSDGSWVGDMAAPDVVGEFGAEFPEEYEDILVAFVSDKTGIPKKKLQKASDRVFGVTGRGIHLHPKYL